MEEVLLKSLCKYRQFYALNHFILKGWSPFEKKRIEQLQFTTACNYVRMQIIV
jgi:hypothetical protein